MDVLGVLVLSGFLGGLAWLLVAAGLPWGHKGRHWDGWPIIGLLFLIGFIWRYFIPMAVRTECACEHIGSGHAEPPGSRAAS